MERRHWTVGLALALAVYGCEAGREDELEMEMEVEEPAAPVSPSPADGVDDTTFEEETAVGLDVAELEGAGAYLTDGEGRALYLFEADAGGESTCYDACAREWPPLIASSTGAAAALVPRVREELIGTVRRRDGTTQITYGGHPLYHYVEDAGPGETTGQDMEDFGAEWYLVTPEGSALHAEGEGHGGS